MKSLFKPLDHNQVRNKLILYMRDKGWKFTYSHLLEFGGIPDGTFVSENGKLLLTEVKPWYTESREFWTGIGQSISMLLESKEVLSLFVYPERYNKWAKAANLLIPKANLGLLSYNEEGQFTPVIDILGNSSKDWILQKEQANIPQIKREYLPDSSVNPPFVCTDCGFVWKVWYAPKGKTIHCPCCNKTNIMLKD
jgi:hypothetical protein